MNNTMRLLFSLLLTGLLQTGTASAAEKPLVYFGVSLRFHPITLYERYQPMLDYLTRNTPFRFELKVGRDYRETLRFLQEGKTDVVSIGDGGLMKGILLAGGVPFVKPLNTEGKPYYRSCFIVPENSPIRTLKEVRGKRLALGYHHSTAGNLMPRYLLQQNGIKLNSLRSVTNLRHHSEVARAVLKGEYDVGVVKESTARRFSRQGLRVLYCSEELPSIPLLVGRNAPKELAPAITKALVRLDRQKPEHRKIMETWDMEYQQGFVPVQGAEYRRLIGKFRSRPLGCGSGCHK